MDKELKDLNTNDVGSLNTKIEDIGFGGLKLFQSSKGFRFGIDAVVLADFANRIQPGAKRVIDLGTGNGVIPIILSHRNRSCRITGIDIQQEAINLAEKSCIMNGLNDRISFICSDILDLEENMPEIKHTADCVLSNPPYVAKGSGLCGADDSRMIARQETTAGLEDFIRTAAMLLRERGHYFLVHRPSRLVDIFYYCRKYRMEPKDVQMIIPEEKKPANIVLIHCILGGGHELKMLPELCVHNEKGGYTEEILKIYEKIR